MFGEEDVRDWTLQCTHTGKCAMRLVPIFFFLPFYSNTSFSYFSLNGYICVTLQSIRANR